MTTLFQAAAAVGASGGKAGPYRVMVVDDSAVIRGLLTRALETDPDHQGGHDRRQRAARDRCAGAARINDIEVMSCSISKCR
jgi:hypothetical protein